MIILTSDACSAVRQAIHRLVIGHAPAPAPASAPVPAPGYNVLKTEESVSPQYI